MSTLKRGRKRKGCFNASSEVTNFKMEKFINHVADTSVLFPNSDVQRWSLKTEWREFTKLYFSSSRPKESCVRSSYDFFQKNRDHIIAGFQQGKDIPLFENGCAVTSKSNTALPSQEVYLNQPPELKDIHMNCVDPEESSDNHTEIASTGIRSDKVSDTPPTHISASCSGHSQNSSTQRSDIAVFREPHSAADTSASYSTTKTDQSGHFQGTVVNAEKSKEIPYFYFPNVTSIEKSIFLVNCNDAYVSDQATTENMKVGMEKSFPTIIQPDAKIRQTVAAALPIDLSPPSNKKHPSPSQKGQSLTKTDQFSECKPSPSFSNENFEGKVGDIIRNKTFHETNDPNHEKSFTFTLDSDILVKLDDKKWEIIIRKEHMMPYNWPKYVAGLLSEYLPHCCLQFKRRKLYPSNSKYVFKMWLYCNIAGCCLDSIAVLRQDKFIEINNKNTLLSHTKGDSKSFQSRFVRGIDRMTLGKTASELSYPSKEFHKRLSNLDERSFLAGNLKDTPMSKNVTKQCAYEYKRSNLEDKNVVESIQLLQQKYVAECKAKTVQGFIQFFSIKPFTIALWTEKDIELYHTMSGTQSLVVDATGSISSKLSGKEIFYFAFLSYDRSVKTEPVAHIELLTDLSTTDTLKFILMRFLEDEKRRFNYTTFSVPLLCTTDFSWPIIKSLIESFNNESVEDYLGRSYLIVTGKAGMNDLPNKKVKTFLHISLCHVMKAFSVKVNKCFKKKEREFVKFVLSLLANSHLVSDVFEIFKHFFRLLFCKFSGDCADSKNVLEGKLQSDIETYKEFKSDNSVDSSQLSASNMELQGEIDDLPIKEDVYLRQSKRSIYFKECEIILKAELELSESVSELPDIEKNVFYSPTFAYYILKNWCGVLPMWTSFHLGDQGRHGTSTPYCEWSHKFADRACIKAPPRTQGIIEFHNKSLKHISLNSKRDRIDRIIGNLFIAKIAKHRQFEISLSRKKNPLSKIDTKVKDTLPKKISVEKWSKRGKKKLSSGPGFFQKKRKKKCNYESQEDWQMVGIIPWGGITESSIQINNTCPLDPFLQILYTFYSLNIQEMRKLFENEHRHVQQICEVVQLLLTDAFADAKYFWLTNICGFSPDLDRNILDSFGTDKQIILYHIQDLFQRKYIYLCSSDQCPTKTSAVESPAGIVSDTTLHEPSDGKDLSLEKSIKEWEDGSSKHSLVSCKERFTEEPDHPEFICEVDHGKEVFRCSGWRNVSNITFVDCPPILIFDISVSFRNKIVSLDEIPLQVCVYGETYKLGGVTSFVKTRGHYVGYIPIKNGFLFYDSLPPDNPVLKKYNMPRIHGDISLIVYFPMDNVDDMCGSLGASVDIGEPSTQKAKCDIQEIPGHCDTDEVNLKADLGKPFISFASSGKQDNLSEVMNELEDVPDDHDETDHLLAKALFEIENENLYKRQLGISYRRPKIIDKMSLAPLTVDTQQCVPSPSPSPSPPSSGSSFNDDGDDNHLQQPLIDFINSKRNFLLDLVSDYSYSSNFHLRSERIMALKKKHH